MNAPVDVLAVMDDARNVLTELGSPGTADGVTEARAALAELVDAAKASLTRIERRHQLGAIDKYEAADMIGLRAALARVGGES